MPRKNRDPFDELTKSEPIECPMLDGSAESGKIRFRVSQEALALFAGFLFLCATTFATAQNVEITLFDSTGQPTAYISRESLSDIVIYLWSGKPVAYIDKGAAGIFPVYRFDGSLVGWFTKGVLVSRDGTRIGAIQEAMDFATTAETAKDAKEAPPAKSAPQPEPARPTYSGVWDDILLNDYLLGR
jgi:hypothetical protein